MFTRRCEKLQLAKLLCAWRSRATLMTEMLWLLKRMGKLLDICHRKCSGGVLFFWREVERDVDCTATSYGSSIFVSANCSTCLYFYGFNFDPFVWPWNLSPLENFSVYSTCTCMSTSCTVIVCCPSGFGVGAFLFRCHGNCHVCLVPRVVTKTQNGMDYSILFFSRFALKPYSNSP